MYGQTGSGKTHTIFGKPGTLTTTSFKNYEKEGEIPPNYGIFPRTMIQLLNEANESDQVTLKASVVEVYFENVFDLLEKRKRLNFGSSAKKKILPFDKPGVSRKYEFFNDRFGRSNRCTKVDKKALRERFKFSGQKEMNLETPLQIAKLVKILENNRTSRSTDMNDRSSRSHCVVTVTMMKRSDEYSSSSIQKSKFIFVDLAGSERIKKSGAEGDRKNEAANVNTSLSALARTITALSSKRPYIPYRDSTLTMILKESFGGSCLTHLIVTIAEDAQHGDESLCSLRFGERSSMIENRVKNLKKRRIVNVGKKIQNIRHMIKEARTEISLLKKRGMAGGLNTVDFAPHIQESWRRNKKMYDDAVTAVEKYKLMLVELNDVTASKKNNREKIEVVKEKLEQSKKVVFVQNGIVQRMIYSGLWKHPHPIYSAKKAELNDLKQKLKSLVQISSVRSTSSSMATRQMKKKSKKMKRKKNVSSK